MKIHPPIARLKPVPAFDGLGEAHELETENHTIAHIYPDSGDWAHYILQAVNNHRALVEALKDICASADANDSRGIHEAIEEARTVLETING